MSVYVDNMAASYGRMKMCHCWADTRDELFNMMRRIGVQMKWFQRPRGDCDFGMDASWEHFDIAMSKRKLAVENGALEVCQYTMVEHASRQNFTKQIDRGQFEAAAYSLRMMCLAAKARQRRYTL